MISISPHVKAIPVVDKSSELFESIWHLEGANYNSYLIETTDGFVIVDTAYEMFCPQLEEEIFSEAKPKEIKYIVVNHMEPDHSGCLNHFLSKTGAKVIISQVGKQLFNPPNSIGVKDGDSISIGDITLKFYMIPWVHWPETMITHLIEDDVLFTCDMYGAFGAYPNLEEKEYLYKEMRRYLAAILLRYKPFVLKAHKRIKSINPSIIAPGHGIVLKENKERVWKWYDSWLEGRGEGVTIVYGCMYGKISYAMGKLTEWLRRRGVKVNIHNVADLRWSYAMGDILDSAVVVFGYPTYEADLFPLIKFFLEISMEKNLYQGKDIVVVETHGWGPTLEKFPLDYGYGFSYGPMEDIDVKAVGESILRLLEGR